MAEVAVADAQVNGVEKKEDLSEEVCLKRDLIVRNLQEVLGKDKLVSQLAAGKNLNVYWGTATTGKPHVGYFVPMQKIADFLKAGLTVKILFADLHAFLDNMKSTFTVLENRVIYYETVIKALMTALDVPIEKLEFRKGTEFQLTPEYTQHVLQLCGIVTQRDALRAGAEVVKQVASPLLSGLLYPLLQALDEEHLKVSGQFGGVDQRKIFILAEEQLHKLKLGKRWHLMNPMVPGLTGGKMSASLVDSKIDLLDSADVVEKKLKSAECPKNSENNGVLSFYEYVVLPIVLPDTVQMNGSAYTTIEKIREDFNADKISEDMLKEYLVNFLNGILGSIQKSVLTDELRKVLELGYPKVVADDVSKVTSEMDESLNLTGDVDKLISEVAGSDRVVNGQYLKQKLSRGEKLKIGFRISGKGRFHLGYLMPLLTLRRLAKAGHQCVIIISDLDAFLDNEKSEWKTLGARSNFVKQMLEVTMKHLGGFENVSFVDTRDFEYTKEYTLDMYKMASKITRDASALVKGGFLASHLIPIYFALDHHYVGVDLAIMGDDMETDYIDEAEQKLGFPVQAARLCEGIGYRPFASLLVPTLLGMNEAKMGASDAENHLEPFDTEKQTKTKISRSFCDPEGNVRGKEESSELNVALHLAKVLLFPHFLAEKGLLISRKEDDGGDLGVHSFAELENLFASKKLHPADLKTAVTREINAIFEPVRKELASGQAKMIKDAFPVKKGGKKK
ncbi:hypothetical protein QR680_008456 [Steinernema hermaphroditum]|uniref:Tyrosine--tRNA ligase n=1 Tax=Steinernema hermaphroditum TaxID=289476 RepID=A0AA39IJ26_9BILA|nr:hypothetical protein QR680_008456 [Steinernema hermaphroditum]